MHLAEAFIQSGLQWIQTIHIFCQYVPSNHLKNIPAIIQKHPNNHSGDIFNHIASTNPSKSSATAYNLFYFSNILETAHSTLENT